MSDSGVTPPTVSEPTGKPSRHQRSAAGMVGAMIITLLVIGGFLALRGVTRDQAEVDVAPVDYQDAVAAAADAGLALVHPRELPDGWKATSVDLTRDESPAWAMGMLTDEGRFVGIRQEEESADDMAAVAIDEDAVAGEQVSLDSEVADTWTAWTDEGGDTGYSAELGDQTVLVYGSAPRADITELVGLLQR
ncbi:DUF4245 family protein [Nocardioides sp. Soil805]|uniref:DUF4245 family protein n=1 Tax=Nocardioides sp. Soil805 TaxID=1736416 RepID=UPI00138EF597|nr:DUF4245 family protein [Nocardioides sp. Soil805]